MSKQTFNLDVAAKIEQDAVYGALALVEAAQRCNWVPIPGENPPWEAASIALMAFLKISGEDRETASIRLAERMNQLQSRAMSEATS